MEPSNEDLETTCSLMGVSLTDSHLALEAKCLRLAQNLPVKNSYHWLGDLGDFFQDIQKSHGEDLLELLARRLLLNFLNQKFWTPTCNVPDSVKLELRCQKERIRREVLEADPGHYRPFADAFYKDFSLLRGKSMPVRTGIADAGMSIWRRPLIFGPLSQRLQFLILMIRPPSGVRCFFQHHTHTSMLSNFNQAGWQETYRLIADLVAVNADYKGFCGASWFYDPQLEDISPRLAYLAKDLINAGAKRFHVGDDSSGSALAKSKTRVLMYEQGKYLPQSYMLVWDRKEMLDWRNEKLRN